jgi:hypothetical protein
MIAALEEIHCARKKEILAMRDSWIRQWGVGTLIKDHKTANENSRK